MSKLFEEKVIEIATTEIEFVEQIIAVAKLRFSDAIPAEKLASMLDEIHESASVSLEQRRSEPDMRETETHRSFSSADDDGPWGRHERLNSDHPKCPDRCRSRFGRLPGPGCGGDSVGGVVMSARAFPVVSCEECRLDIGALPVGAIPLCPDCHANYLGPLWAEDENETNEEVA